MLPSANQAPVRQLWDGDPRPLPPEGEKSKSQAFTNHLGGVDNQMHKYSRKRLSSKRFSKVSNRTLGFLSFVFLPIYISNISGTFEALLYNNSSSFPAQVNNLNWHLGCLECSVCRASLRQHNSCYVKNKEIFCKLDYFR